MGMGDILGTVLVMGAAVVGSIGGSGGDGVVVGAVVVMGVVVGGSNGHGGYTGDSIGDGGSSSGQYLG